MWTDDTVCRAYRASQPNRVEICLDGAFWLLQMLKLVEIFERQILEERAPHILFFAHLDSRLGLCLAHTINARITAHSVRFSRHQHCIDVIFIVVIGRDTLLEEQALLLLMLPRLLSLLLLPLVLLICPIVLGTFRCLLLLLPILY